MTAKRAKQNKGYVDQNPVEAFRDIGSGIAQSVKTDLAKESINGLWKQILGTGEYGNKKVSGDLEEGQEVNLRTEKPRSEEKDPGIDYRRSILRGEEQISYQQSKDTEMLIRQILVEIKQLAVSTKELQVEFKEVVTEQRIEKPGKYHIRFFEWVLSVVRLARMRIEDSSSWLQLFASKKRQRQYWNMFKKHGTTFGLSNERVVATQTG